MKKTSILILTLLVMCAFVFPETKIGVVNSQELLQKSKKGAEVTKRLTDFQNKKGAEMQAMQEDIKKLEKDLINPALNDETREKKTAERDNKAKILKRYYEDAQNEFERESQKELMEIEKDIMPLIEQIGKEKGFTFILDLSRSGIVYMDNSIDITDELVKALDAKTPAAGPANK